jgi:hypothetical protein
MSLIDRLRECNDADTTDYLPLRVPFESSASHLGAIAGWVHPEMAPRLARHPNVFLVKPDSVTLAPALDTYGKRSVALNEALRSIYERDSSGFGRWCDEVTPVVPALGGTPLFDIERCATMTLGIWTTGVHLNGYVRQSDEIAMMVARRSHKIAAQPGKLDQIVAGFLPVGGDPVAKLVAEAEEEAGISAEMLRAAQPVAPIGFQMRVPLGLKRGICLTYDLELPDDFVPVNHDGEVEGFELLSAKALIEILSAGPEFKFDCALVVLRFLIRHGIIDCDHPNYRALVDGLAL